MTFVARLALAVTLIVPLGAASLHAQPTFSPGLPGGPDKPGGGVFRPTAPDVPPAPPPTTGGADWGNSQVEIAYTEPQDPQFRPIRERLMRRQVLEQLRLFLSPLRLPRKLLVQLDQCNAERRPYVSGGPVTICYEYVAKVDRTAPREQQLGMPPRETMIVGAFIQAVLHEVALATYDILDVPIWGRETDAADMLAAFMMVQFGKEVAVKVMTGATWFFEASDRTWNETDMASDQSPEAQRFFNYLCIAFGADQTSFKFLIDRNLLPVNRARGCVREFFAVRSAFVKEIMPHVDQPLLKRVQSATWLILDEPK